MPLESQRVRVPLNFNLAPKSSTNWDPIARHRGQQVHDRFAPWFWRTYVGDGYDIPHDFVYVLIAQTVDSGDSDGAALTDNNSGTTTWDATEEQFYETFNGASDSWGNPSGARILYPTGWYGKSATYNPKHAAKTKCVIRYKARFPTNADYTTDGVGACNTTTFAAANHCIQVTRNSGNWEVSSADSSTYSTSAAAGADGAWHVHKIEWDANEIRLYVDDTLTITKTTNRPAQPIGPLVVGKTEVGDVDVVDFEVHWE